MTQRGDQLIQARLQKLDSLRELGINPYPTSYEKTHTNSEAKELFEKNENSEKNVDEAIQVSLAGRVMAIRQMGKAVFIDIDDSTAKIQLHLKEDILQNDFILLDQLDIGDFIGTSGKLFRTRRGEITLESDTMTFLAKSLKPPPEKWHGLKNVEIRYRQRYLDLLSNRDVTNIFFKRSKIISSIRNFMESQSFIEVETPVLVPIAAGAMAQPFVTQHNALNQTLYMRIATELYLKRLIIGGMDKVFEIGRVFRNEGIDMNHNPEFTMMESYEAYADYNQVMQMVENLVNKVANECVNSTSVEFQGNTIELKSPWQRISMKDAIKEYSGIDLDNTETMKNIKTEAGNLGIRVEQLESTGRIVDKLISKFVEPKLIQPTFLIDYPTEMSPLAKAKTDNPNYVERFEAFIGGMEIANSYSELNDPIIQRERFEEQEAFRETYTSEEDFDRLDEDFLEALEYGMPPTGGLGVGIDRLVMILTEQDTIRDVVLFPQMRTARNSNE